MRNKIVLGIMLLIGGVSVLSARVLTTSDKVYYKKGELVQLVFPYKVVNAYSSKSVELKITKNVIIVAPETDFILHVILEKGNIAISFIEDSSLFEPLVEYELPMTGRFRQDTSSIDIYTETGLEKLVKAMYNGDTITSGFFVVNHDTVYGPIIDNIKRDSVLIFKTPSLDSLRVKTKVIRRYYSSVALGVVVKVKAKHPVLLRETDFYLPGVRAVALSQRAIPKNGEAIAFVIADRNILIRKPAHHYVR